MSDSKTETSDGAWELSSQENLNAISKRLSGMWWQSGKVSPQLCNSLPGARLCEPKGASQTGAQRRKSQTGLGVI